MNYITFVEEDPTVRSVYHLLVARTLFRKDMIKFLGEHGIATGIHYPIPLHLQPAYKHLGSNYGDLPRCEKIAEEIISLPIFPEITDEQIDFVVQTIKEYIK